ncbi:hypothetical protein AaE_000969, partial [Aphanomyces astaci]
MASHVFRSTSIYCGSFLICSALETMAAYDVVETPSAVASHLDTPAPEPPVKRNCFKEFYFGIPGILTGAAI